MYSRRPASWLVCIVWQGFNRVGWFCVMMIYSHSKLTPYRSQHRLHWLLRDVSCGNQHGSRRWRTYSLFRGEPESLPYQQHTGLTPFHNIRKHIVWKQQQRNVCSKRKSSPSSSTSIKPSCMQLSTQLSASGSKILRTQITQRSKACKSFSSEPTRAEESKTVAGTTSR